MKKLKRSTSYEASKSIRAQWEKFLPAKIKGSVGLKFTALVPLRKFEVAAPLGRDYKLNDGIYFTNDANLVLKKLLHQPELASYLGRLEIDSIKTCKCFAYSEQTIQIQKEKKGQPVRLHEVASEVEQCGQQFLFQQINRLRNFLNMLWTIDDNSASIENCFVFTEGWIQERFIGPINNSASLDKKSCFSLTQFSEACKMYSYLRFDDEGITSDVLSLKDKPGLTISQDQSPLMRAFFQLGNAKSTWHEGPKIAAYCSALEALLMGDSASELTFRLSLRVAWLIADSEKERKIVFKTMLAIYKMRSASVHGGTVKKSKIDSSLVDLVIKADDILRRVITKMSDNQLLVEYGTGKHKNSELFEEYMQSLCLGGEGISSSSEI